jgi:multidrug resistance efflux pump
MYDDTFPAACIKLYKDFPKLNNMMRTGFRPPHTAIGETDAEQTLWSQFAGAGSPAAFCESWLSLQASMLEGIHSGLVLLGNPDTGPFSPMAVWPSATVSVNHLTAIAERALRERRGLVVNGVSLQDTPGSDPDGLQIAYPLEVSGKIHGAIVLELAERPAQQIQAAMRTLHWGAAWLEVLLLRTNAAKSAEAYERLQRLLDMIATAVEYRDYRPAALAFVTRLAGALECDRVSLGFKKRNRIRISVLSHSAEFGERMNVVLAIESAMDEAVDQKAIIVYPAPEGAPALITRAHEALARTQAAKTVCTVPLDHGGSIYGALTVERIADKPFDDTTLELVKTIAAMAGPILEAKQKEDRPLISKISASATAQLQNLVGPRHLGLKLAVIAAALVVIFFYFAKGRYRVGAPTLLEGTVQRVISAPFDGYVAEAPARPGDVVRQGSLLAQLDNRDLKLERLKWMTEQEQFLVQQSEALAKHDRAQVGILHAKIEQAKAQINLLDEQLSRAKVTAPFDGVITSGDLSQSLGTPVERGQGLFEIAPLGGYRIILQVDERDIAQVKETQRGELVLPSLPGKHFPLTVSQITPVSTQKEGRNYFRVEARLDEHSVRLRPGMEGVGKITIDRRRLIWIWTHEMIEWISLKVWTWWP